MMSKRMPLALALSAVLFVTSGFAATKKIQRHDGSRDWNDLSLQNDSALQNGNLLNAGRSVSSGSVGFQSSGASGGSGSSLILGNSGADPSWIGGTGNWSDPSKWKGGEPGMGSDVLIDSGGKDLVSLDTSPPFIGTLTIGGATGGGSQLRGDGTAQSLHIEGTLTINQTGQLFLSSNDTVTVFWDVTVMPANPKDPGAIDLENGSRLTVSHDVNNSRDIYTSFYGSGGNTLTIDGALTNNAGAHFNILGTSDVANVGGIGNYGSVYVGTGATLNLTNEPKGITDVVAGANWFIYGNFAVAGVANTGFANLTSVEGSVNLGNRQATNITPGGGVLTVSSGGGVDVNTAGTSLQINGDVHNSGRVSTSYDDRGAVTLTVTGTLTNNPGGDFSMGKANLAGSTDAANLGGLVNSNNATVEVYNGSTLTVKGGVSNSGLINVNNGSSINSLVLNNGGTINIDSKSQLVAGTFGEIINSKSSFGVININGHDGVGAEKLNVILQPGFDQSAGGTYQFAVGNGSNAFSGIPIQNDIFDDGQEMWVVIPGGKLTNVFASHQDPWLGGTDKWSNGSNWGSGVPGAADNVRIGYGFSGNVTLDVGSTTINSLSVDIFSTLTDRGVKQTLNVNDAVSNEGTLDFYGGSSVNAGADLRNNPGGLIWLRKGSTLWVAGNLNNFGDVHLLDASTLTVMGNFYNGTFLDSGILDANGVGNKITITGLLTNTAGAQITLSSTYYASDVLQALAGLSNGGMINLYGSQFVVGTGNPSGLGYIQLHNGTLTEMISSPTSFGVINVNGGSALLDGTLNILLQGGYIPDVGSVFQFLLASISGKFADIQNDCFNNGKECWLVTYDQGYVELTAEQAPVPEPATLLVLIPGLLGAGYGLRRKLCRP